MGTAAQAWTAIDYLLGGTVACLAVFLFGSIAHAVLRQNGLGTVLNGLLLVVGMMAGAVVRAATIGL